MLGAVTVAAAALVTMGGGPARADVVLATTSLKAGSYAVWRVHVPAVGQLDVSSTGLGIDGPATLGGVIPASLLGHRGCCGGGMSGMLLDARLGGLRLSEAMGGGASSGAGVTAGDYYVIQMAGRGTLGLGSLRTTLSGPEGTTILGFGTGAVTQYTDADFISGSYALPVLHGPIDGSIPLVITHQIVGAMASGNQTASVGFRDPDGTGNDFPPGGGIGWFGMGPGAYQLRLHETTYSAMHPVVALIADLTLP